MRWKPAVAKRLALSSSWRHVTSVLGEWESTLLLTCPHALNVWLQDAHGRTYGLKTKAGYIGGGGVGYWKFDRDPMGCNPRLTSFVSLWTRYSLGGRHVRWCLPPSRMTPPHSEVEFFVVYFPTLWHCSVLSVNWLWWPPSELRKLPQIEYLTPLAHMYDFVSVSMDRLEWLVPTKLGEHALGVRLFKHSIVRTVSGLKKQVLRLAWCFFCEKFQSGVFF